VEERNKENRRHLVTVVEMDTISPYQPIITLNINGVNSLSKHRVAEWMKKQDQTIHYLRKRFILVLWTHIDGMLKDGKRYSRSLEKKSEVLVLNQKRET
jgi:hypothetical protein